MSENDNSDKFRISLEELAHALTIFIGGKVGISEEVTAEEAGRRGSFIYHIIKTLLKGEGDWKKIREILIIEVIAYLVSYVLEEAGNIAIEAAVQFLVTNGLPYPVAIFLKETLKAYVKNFIKINITKQINKVWTKVKIFIKNLIT